jgi:hypothetical protein
VPEILRLEGVGLVRDGRAIHVEEIPRGFTHVLLLRGGRPLRAGPIEETLTAEALTACFGIPLHVHRRNGRYSAWGVEGLL